MAWLRLSTNVSIAKGVLELQGRGRLVEVQTFVAGEFSSRSHLRPEEKEI